MKSGKFLVAIAAIAAVSMSSCSQEEELVNNQPSDNAIAFSTYIGTSRGSVIDLPALQAKEATGFGVLAYYTGQYKFGGAPTDADPQTPNFMYNQQVTYTNGAWTYEPLKYWPNNSRDMISFFAYAPYTASFGGKECITALSDNDAAGEPTLNFVVASDVADQIDLLYAVALKDQEKPDYDKTVDLSFKHALSRVSFSRQLVIDNGSDKLATETTVTINSVTFTATSFGTKGTLNLNTGEWDVTGYSDKEEYILSTDKNNIQNNVINGGEESTKVETLTDNTGEIMFIPVNITEDGDAQGTITVNYTVTTTDNNLYDGASEITNDITVDVPAINFEAGKAYNFVLKIGLTSVKLAAVEVANWETGAITEWESKTF